jgi:hypothetical protein
MPRYFEQVVLIEEETHRTVIERRYNDGAVEYWSVMALQVSNGVQTGTAQVPFRISIPDAFDIENGEHMNDAEFELAMTAKCREAAFSNFDASMKSAEDGAKREVMEGIQRQQRQEQTKILLANSLPR